MHTHAWWRWNLRAWKQRCLAYTHVTDMVANKGKARTGLQLQ